MAGPALDPDTLRFLEIHEASVHAIPGRTLRDLGHAVMLHDPLNPEPFWNRLTALRWPSDPAEFEQRLDETLTLFATLDRWPHIWPRPLLNEPEDLVERLLAAGFEDAGRGELMLLVDPGRARARAQSPGHAFSVERIHGVIGDEGISRAADVARVLSDAFGVEPERRRSIEFETAAVFDHPDLQAYLVRVDGEPAAVAKRATFDGASYLSSIGTSPSFRGRGLGSFVSAVATVDAIEAGSRWVYLGVFSENLVARRMYERLGFAQVGRGAPDLIMR